MTDLRTSLRAAGCSSSCRGSPKIPFLGAWESSGKTEQIYATKCVSVPSQSLYLMLKLTPQDERSSVVATYRTRKPRPTVES